MANTNVIELNGKRYDALSGKLLNRSAVLSETGRLQKSPAPTVIDDFIRHQQPAETVNRKKITVHSGSAASPTAKAGHHLHAHAPQHTKTLMRRGVAKPGLSFRSQLRVQVPVGSAPVASVKTAAGTMADVTPARWHHAQHTTRSNSVRRFAEGNSESLAVTHRAHLPVHPAPSEPSSPSPSKLTTLTETALARATAHQQTPPPKTRRRWLGRRHHAQSHV